MTPERLAAAAIAAAVSAHREAAADTIGRAAVEAISAAGLIIASPERITDLLDANSALIEERRALSTRVATGDAITDAIIDALGRGLVEAKERRAAAEARAEESANQALRMLPARIEAERQRDAARTSLRTLRAAISGIVARGVETFQLTSGDVRVTSAGENRFATAEDVQELIDHLAGLLPPQVEIAAEGAAPDA